MKFVCVSTAVMLSLAPVGTLSARHARERQGADSPAQESRTPSSVIGSKEERVGKAAGFYEKGRFVEAALEFEGLVKDFPQEPNFLFNAAVSRYGAGHYAHTVAYTREYLTHRTLTPEDRKEAEAQLNEAVRKAVTVRVTVRAPAGGAGEATVVAQHVARASSDLRPELLFPVKLAGQPANVSLELDPGAWMLRVEGPGYAKQERRVELALGAASAQEFTLAAAPAEPSRPTGEPGPARDVPPAVARKVALGFGIAGGVAMVAGLVTTGVGAAGVKGLKTKFDVTTCVDMDAADPYVQCREDWRAPYRLREVGIAVLGAGVGGVVGGLTWTIKDARKRRTALLAEAAIGGVAGLAGGLSLLATRKPFNEANGAADWQAEHTGTFGKMGGHAASMFGLGLGIGLFAGSVLGLAIQRKHTSSLRAGALTGPGQAGMVLSGSF